MHFGKDISGHLNILNGKHFVNLLRRLSLFGEVAQLIGIEVRTGDGLLKYRGVRSDTAQTIFVDQSLKFPRSDQLSLDVVVPNRLPEPGEFNKWISAHGISLPQEVCSEPG